MTQLVFKIEDAGVWQAAVDSGSYRGAPVDQADGFVHLSAANQVSGTLDKHFHGRTNLVLIAFRAERLGANLKWERSRGGSLFPHFYGALSPALAWGVRLLPDTHHLDGFADWGLAP